MTGAADAAAHRGLRASAMGARRDELLRELREGAGLGSRDVLAVWAGGGATRPPPATGICDHFDERATADCNCTLVRGALVHEAYRVCRGDTHDTGEEVTHCHPESMKFGINDKGTCAICFSCVSNDGTQRGCESTSPFTRTVGVGRCQQRDMPIRPGAVDDVGDDECFPWSYGGCLLPLVSSAHCECPDYSPAPGGFPRLTRRFLEEWSSGFAPIPVDSSCAAGGGSGYSEAESQFAAEAVLALVVSNSDLARYAACRTQQHGREGAGGCLDGYLQARTPLRVEVVPVERIHRAPGTRGATPPWVRASMVEDHTLQLNCDHRDWAGLLAAIRSQRALTGAADGVSPMSPRLATSPSLACLLARYGAAVVHELAHACGAEADSGTPGVFGLTDPCTDAFRAGSLMFGLLQARFQDPLITCGE